MDFLQSEIWRRFQEAAGRRTFHFEREGFWVNAVEHELPLVGKYFYIPRGIVLMQNANLKNQNDNEKLKIILDEIIETCRKKNIGWVRVDVDTEGTLELLKRNTKLKIAKAPHDMQPKETFVIDITKSEEELLAEMKPKTRYNIRLAEKKGVVVKCHPELVSGSQKNTEMLNQVQHDSYLDDFLRLTKVMAKRQGITPHGDEYYRKMVETIPAENLRLYVAEYENRVIAANLVVFFEKKLVSICMERLTTVTAM